MRECARHPKYIYIELYIIRMILVQVSCALRAVRRNWKSKLEEDLIGFVYGLVRRMQTCSGKFDNIWKIARDIGIKLSVGHLLNIDRGEYNPFYSILSRLFYICKNIKSPPDFVYFVSFLIAVRIKPDKFLLLY